MTIEEQLRQVWKQQRRFCHMRGLCRCVLWLALLLPLVFLLDWGLLFKNRVSSGATLLLSFGGSLLMLWVLWHDWLRHLRPYDATRIALEVEAAHPELMSSLVSYTQMESMDSRSEASPELLQAMRDFAVQQTRRLRLSDIIDYSQLIKLIAVAFLVLLIIVGMSIRWSDHFTALARRLAGIEASYPIQTKLVSISGDLIVPLGEAPTIVVKPGGVIPRDAILHIKQAESESAPWSELPMEKLAGGATFRRELDAPDRDMEYFVTMGDCRSESHRIYVVRAPRIVKAQLQLDFPNYLNRPVETTDQLSLEVPEGTRIEWQLRCDKDVDYLDVLVGDERLEAVIGPSGRDISFSTTANRRFTYSFEWTEGASGKSFQFQDVEYSIKTIKDTKPRISLSGNAPSGLATVGKRANIRWHAQDDYGLDKIWLVYTVTKPGQTEEPTEQRILLQDAEGRLGDDSSRIWTLAEEVPDLKSGQQISYHVEATDLMPDEKGERAARSQVRQVSIVGDEEYIQWYQRQLAKHNEVVKKAFIAERDVSTQIDQLLSTEEGDQP